MAFRFFFKKYKFLKKKKKKTVFQPGAGVNLYQLLDKHSHDKDAFSLDIVMPSDF